LILLANIIKPLNEWRTIDEVQQWFRKGKYSKYSEEFAKLDGKDLSKLLKDDFGMLYIIQYTNE